MSRVRVGTEKTPFEHDFMNPASQCVNSKQKTTLSGRLQRAGLLCPTDPVGNFFKIRFPAASYDPFAFAGFGKRPDQSKQIGRAFPR